MGRRILKWTLWSCLSLLLLAGVVIVCAGYLAGTPSGLGFLLDRGRGVIPGELSVGDIEGGLFGHLCLRDVRYRDRVLSVKVDMLVLDWVPAELLHHRFHVRLLKVDGVHYKGLQQGEEKGPEKEVSGPFALSDIKLPVAVVLDDVQVNGVHVIQGAASKPVKIDRLALAASFDKAGLALSRLEFLMPGISFHLQGRLDPVGNYPLDFRMRWSASFKGKQDVAVAGRGRLEGDIRQLNFTHSVKGDVEAELEAHASDVLGKLHWDANVAFKNVSSMLLARSMAMPVLEDVRPQLDINAKGDLRHADVTLSCRVSPAKLQPSSDNSQSVRGGRPEDSASPVEGPRYGPVGTPAGVMELDAKAGIIFDPVKFDASGNWKGVQWPLAGPPQYVSEKGTFSASGTPSHYVFSFDANVNGRDIPDVVVKARGRGTEKDMDLDSLHANLLGGVVDVKAKAGWKPFVTWQAAVTASGIDPGVYAPDWPGAIGLDIESTGSLKGKKPDLDVSIRSLHGTLRGRRLFGQGTVRVAGSNVDVQGLKLGLGTARVNVQGAVGRKWDLDWSVSVPDVSELLPDGHGTVRSSGHLSGTPAAPAVVGMAEVKDFKFSGAGCRQLQIDFSLFRDESEASSLRIGADGLSSGGQTIEKASLSLDGTLSSHELKVSAVHEAVTLKMQAGHGRYDIRNRDWTGVLTMISLHSRDFGDWNLARPVNLDLSPERAEVSRLCMADGVASVCMKADWVKHGSGTVSASLKGITLDRFMKFMPPDITGLTGEINADLRADIGKRPVANLNLSLSPGVMTYVMDRTRQVRIEYQGGHVDALLGNRRLSADVRLSMGENGLNAHVDIPRNSLEKDVKTAPLSGNIKLKVRELGLITAFVPAVKETEGELDADFRLGGSIGDPRVEGTAVLNMNGPDIPMIGLDLDETKFEVRADSSRGLEIKGLLKSGKDSLNIAGSALLDPAQVWPAHVELTGSNFMVVNIPDAMVRISPDVKVDYSGKAGVKVRGEVKVPQAEITPQEIPSGVKKPSKDVVIVSHDNPSDDKPALPVDADITVNLLDNVHIKGFGLDCYVKGKMTVVMLPGKQPAAHGELRISKGTFRFYGHNLTIERGIISYAGGRIDNPGINLLAVRDVGGTPVGVQVTGYVSDLDISGYSTDPSISSSDALTMLITGKTKNDPGFSEAAANTAAIAGADMLAQQLKSYTGLDHLDVSEAGENSSETRVVAGKDITKDLTVGVEAGTDDDGTMFVARYHIWKGLNLEMKSGAARSGMNVLYTITFK